MGIQQHENPGACIVVVVVDGPGPGPGPGINVNMPAPIKRNKVRAPMYSTLIFIRDILYVPYTVHCTVIYYSPRLFAFFPNMKHRQKHCRAT